MEPDFAFRWERVEAFFREKFGKPQTTEAILFLIGMRELGSAPREFTKEEKRDLMHMALCRLLSQMGFYELEYVDAEGWAHWRELKPLPHTDIFSQEHLLRTLIVEYFETEAILV